MMSSVGDDQAKRQLLLSYSTNVKNYAKWFDIARVELNEKTFTKYKLIYRVLLQGATIDFK